MPAASMKQLLESGVHFGHQTRRWNPKMAPYIFTDRGGIHIIDLQKSIKLVDTAYDFVRNIVDRGGTVLFVGTKKQCQDSIKEEAERVGMPYVSHRWLGGLLTNFSTIHERIKRLHELRRLKGDGSLDLLPTKEQISMERELAKLEVNLGGVADMERLPDAVLVIDPKRELIATKEVNKLGIPLIGLVDTNCDPDEVDYLIPGNDDAIRSCGLIIRTIANAVAEAAGIVKEDDFQEAQSEDSGEAAEADPEVEVSGEADTVSPQEESTTEEESREKAGEVGDVEAGGEESPIQE